jgi:beta-lactamase regulating signal transducer with metallopeptidase domain
MNSIETSFDWFLSATARGSLMVLAVLLAQAALGRKLPAVWRHALWLPVLFVLGSPVLPESPLSLENQWSASPVAAVTLAADPVSAAAPQATDAPVATPPAPAWDAPRIAACVWMAGVFAILLAGVVAWHRTLAAFRRRAVRLSAELRGEIDEAARSRGLRSLPAVLVSDAVPGPAMSGILRPILLLPSSFEATFAREERRLILLHEMTHVKRGDLLLNAIVFLLQAVHWCNPLVWFAFARFRADRELACDSAVLSAVDDDRRSVYGHALLKVETTTALPPRHLGLVGLVGLFGRGRALRSRLAAISAHRGAHPASTFAGLVLLLGLAFAGATRAQNERPSEPGQAILIEAKFVEVPAGAKLEIQSGSSTYDQKTGTAIFSADTNAVEKLVATAGADVLSAPSVVTTSGKKATVEIGQQVPDGSGGLRHAGVSFEVLPTIREGSIQLALQLHISEPKSGSDPLTFRERKVKTEVSVQPNDVVVIGGVNQADDGGDERRLFLSVRTRLVESPEEVRKRLEAIIIPELIVSETPLTDVLDFLSAKSRELDPAKQGVNLVHLPAEGSPEPRITLTLKSVPLSEAIRYVAALSDLEVEFGDPSVTLRPRATAPKPAAPAAATPGTVPGVASGPKTTVLVTTAEKNKTAELAARLVLPRADFQEASLPEVIQFLQKKSIELDPKKQGLNFLLKVQGQPTPDAIRISLSLREVPLSEAIRYVAELAGLELRFEENAVVLSRDEPPVASGNDFRSAVYALSRGRYRRLLDASPDPEIQSALAFQGIPFPDGATVSWEERDGGVLLVRNTSANLELVAALLADGVVFR